MVEQGKILVCALALLLLPVALSPSAHAIPKEVLNKPIWRVGDFWNYNVSISVPDPTGGPTHNGTGTAIMTVNATEKLALESASYDTFRLTTRTRVLMDGILTIDFVQVEWHLTSDLSLVKSIVNFSFAGSELTSEEAYGPPQLMQWPVVSGGSWTSNSTITIDVPAFQAHFVQPETASFTADTPQKVTIAAGTFRTLPLQKTVTIYGTGFSRGSAFSLYANEMGLLVWRYLSSDNSVIMIRSFWSNEVVQCARSYREILDSSELQT